MDWKFTNVYVGVKLIMESTHASVTVYDGSDFAILLCVQKACSKMTYLFVIHKITGSLDFTNILGHSIFENMSLANEYMDKIYPNRKETAHGIGLIGLNRFGSKLCIFFVKEAVPVAYYANKHTIYQIKKADNIWFDLPFYDELTNDEKKRVNRIENFPIADLHMFCDTADLTVTIGHTVSKPDFIWNAALAQPFEELGVRDACISLLQGCASTQLIPINNVLVRMTLITIRSYEHGGTRYKARGLNKGAYPANEVQCEFILEASDGSIFSHVWRRGTVPVEWRTDANIASSHIIIEENNDALSPIYFNRLKKEYMTEDFKGFVIMNLLHNNEKHSERKLCNAYENAVKNISFVKYISFDWHENSKNLGLPKAVEKYITEILDKIESPTFTVQIPLTRVPADNTETKTMKFANDAKLKDLKYSTEQRQEYVIRINCLDSLDRTNVGSFWYACLLVLKYSGSLSLPFQYSEATSLPLNIRSFLGNSFIRTGNTVSSIYTDTEACMTQIFRDYGEISEKTFNDSVIAIKRRTANIFSDKERDKVIRMFSGVDVGKILKGLSFGIDLVCASAFPGRFLLPFPGSLRDENELFKLTEYNPSSLLIQQVTNKTQIRLLLNKPVYISAIVLRSSSDNQPSFLTVEGGLTQTSMIPLSEKFAIPICSSSTPLIIKIPPDVSNGNHPLSRIVLLTFITNGSCLNISNIFVFGSAKQITPIQKYYPETYTDLSFIEEDKYWPRITDTSPLRDIISMHTQPTLDNAIEIELARLHHHHTKLETASLLLMQGLNPQDFALTNFKFKPSSEMGKHNCIASTPGDQTWKCYLCGMIFCSKCSEQHVVEPCLLFDERCFLCQNCFEQFDEKIKKLKNLRRFYLSFKRLHYPSQDNWEKWFVSNIPHDSNGLLSFPRTAFIDANETGEMASKPETNLVLSPKGGNVSGSHSFQLAFGVTHKLSKISVIGSDDIRIEIHALGNNDSIGNDRICVIKGDNKDVNVSMCTSFLLIYMTQGTLNRINFEGTPYVRKLEYTKQHDESSVKIPAPITRRINFSGAEQTLTFKFSKQTRVSGIIYEKFAGGTGLVVAFVEGENDGVSECEYFYLPVGAQDFATNFQKQHNATTVMIYVADRTALFQSTKISLF